MADSETIPQYLARMANAEHRLKGDNGHRSTREVADYFGISMAAARYRLNKLFDAGVIDAFDNGNDHMGAPISWAAKS